MGLDVHDMENLGEVNVGYDGQPKSAEFGLKSLRLAKPLKAGMVLTVITSYSIHYTKLYDRSLT